MATETDHKHMVAEFLGVVSEEILRGVSSMFGLELNLVIVARPRQRPDILPLVVSTCDSAEPDNGHEVTKKMLEAAYEHVLGVKAPDISRAVDI